jgi:hypothetical protein
MVPIVKSMKSSLFFLDDWNGWNVWSDWNLAGVGKVGMEAN